MNRRLFLGVLASSARAEVSASARDAGVAWLGGRQNADGGWHSAAYGLLRSGHSLTGLVVNALLDSGMPVEHPRVARAAGFLADNVNAEGALGMAGDDYPCYATALGLRAIVRVRGVGNVLVPRMIEWLRGQQMSPQNGWTRANPAFGAWGIGGRRREAPDSGHIDLSMTRHVLEGLAEAAVPASDPLLEQAGVFVRRCRNDDGGCFFSTVETGANKAGEEGAGYRGYGTTTADGVLALHAIGDRAGAAQSLDWLRAHDHPWLPRGFGSEARMRYAVGLRYYYADAAVRAFRAMNQRRLTPYADALRKAQRRDGSWSNAESLVKEDDPLIATAFAVSALSLGA